MPCQQYMEEKHPQLTHTALKNEHCQKVGRYSRCSAFQQVSRIPGRQRRRPWLFRAYDTALALASLCKDLRASLKVFLPMFLIKKVTIWPLNQNLSHTFPPVRTSEPSLFPYSQTRVWWMEILWHGNRAWNLPDVRQIWESGVLLEVPPLLIPQD